MKALIFCIGTLFIIFISGVLRIVPYINISISHTFENQEFQFS